jgi:hypothetical protein
MSDLEDRVATLETRTDNLTTEVRFGTHLGITAIREARIASKAHQKNIKLLNALRKTQAEHSRTLSEHTKRLDTIDGRLDTIDGKLGQMTFGMHTIESLLRQLVEQG